VPSDRGGLSAGTRLEIIPIRGVEDQFDVLPKGATVTVTSSPRLGLERTLAYTELLAREGMDAVPHLAAKHIVDRHHLAVVLARVREVGVRDAFVVGGDGDAVAGSFTSGLELLEAVAELDHGLQRLGVAAYPDGHPLIDDATLLAALERKQRVADYTVTQMCFDPELVVAWLRRMRGLGISLPVYLGVPGPVRRTKLLEIALKLGVRQSVRFAAKQEGLLSRLVRPGVYRPDEFTSAIAGLTRAEALGMSGFQVFTFNELAATMKWQRRAS
jgi:methylenetetrahydrofolate reductase (NADPH)